MGIHFNWHIIFKLPDLNPFQHLSLTYLSFFPLVVVPHIWSTEVIVV